MNDADVSELAGRAQRGDPGAFEDLVQRMVRPALAAAWEFVRTREDAEDVVQEAFARAWKDLDRYDASRPFAPWFFTIVRNAARNAHRRDRRWQEVPITDDVVERVPDERQDRDPVDRLHFDDRIVALLEELSPMQRSCFRLAELEGFSRDEVATMLGVTAATVRVHVHRARKALQSRLGSNRGGVE
jgi:RNA polymerase sigma-70 factor (ECF subfamily)